MEHRAIVLRLPAPPDQNAAEAIHPTVRPLHGPTPSFLMRLALHFLRVLPLGRDMSREAKFLYRLPHLIIRIPFVQTQVLLVLGVGLRSFDRNTRQRLLGQLHIGTVGPVHGQAHRDAVAFHQQAALDAFLGAVGGVFARLFPPRGALWSCTRPSTTRTSRCPSNSHIPAARPSTSQRRARPEPTPESGHAPWTRGKKEWRSRPSTGSRCGARRKWRPCRPDSACAACRRRTGGCSHVWESAIRSRSTDHPECARRLRIQAPGRPWVYLRWNRQLHKKQQELHTADIAAEGLSG